MCREWGRFARTNSLSFRTAANPEDVLGLQLLKRKNPGEFCDESVDFVTLSALACSRGE